MKVVVAQKGTREYFLAPRAFHRKGWLTKMVVDWYTPFRGFVGRALQNSKFSSLSKAFGAHTEELPASIVKPMYFLGFYIRIYEKHLRKASDSWEKYNRGDLIFAERIARMKLPDHDLFFGYAYSSLEILASERAKGKWTVLDQIDPGALEREIIQEEEEKWPGYVLERVPDFSQSYKRNRAEWDLADIVIVNSEWSKECIIKKGCRPDKVDILPLAYEQEIVSGDSRTPPPPLKVLWLGRVTLQKGIPYLVEAARLLSREPVEFHVAGTLAISRDAMAQAPDNIRWLGNVSINKKMELYCSCHVFVLPTLSDGFAITQLEAFANGMPVVATIHCGQVVEDGLTGFLVKAADPKSLAEALIRFLRQPLLSNEMGERCLGVVQDYSVGAYADRLVEIINRKIPNSFSAG
jgi:glycosyltransferase involved in cell wall biosynthesis